MNSEKEGKLGINVVISVNFPHSLSKTGVKLYKVLFLFAFLFSSFSSSWAVKIPPIPPARDFIYDGVGLLKSGERTEIARIQEEAFNRYDTPIIVVIIDRRANYDGDAMTLEQFSKAWFDAWQIGKPGQDGKIINKGILLLICQQDRRARIQLGGDWGNSWDNYCEAVMQNILIYNFKKEKYYQGIRYSASALLEMAKQGPTAPPLPSGMVSSGVQEIENIKVSTSFLTGGNKQKKDNNTVAKDFTPSETLCRKWLIPIGVQI